MTPINIFVLLDMGCDISIMSSIMCDRFSISSIIRDRPLNILNFVDKKVLEAGSAFTRPVEFTFENHTNILLFKISRTNNKFDMIPPYSWIAKYRVNVYGDKLTFGGKLCNSVCGKASTNFEIEGDNSITQEVYTGCIYMVESNNLEGDILLALKEGPPAAYHKYLVLITRRLSEKLPPYGIFDHAIDLIPDSHLHQDSMYSLSETELEELRKYIDKMVGEGKIRPSSSPVVAPIHFVLKTNGRGQRLCTDYYGLN